VIVQARLGSSRFKNKILAPLANTTVLGYMLKRVCQSRTVDNIVVAIPEKDISLPKIIKSYGIDVYKGSESNVLDRYYSAAIYYQADTIIRLTSDCPHVDPVLIDEMVSRYGNDNIDYLGFGLNPFFPDGLGTEVFNYASLEYARKNANKPEEKEHVTWYIKTHPKLFKLGVHSLEKIMVIFVLLLIIPRI